VEFNGGRLNSKVNHLSTVYTSRAELSHLLNSYGEAIIPVFLYLETGKVIRLKEVIIVEF
jgi:hypothetical protein